MTKKNFKESAYALGIGATELWLRKQISEMEDVIERGEAPTGMVDPRRILKAKSLGELQAFALECRKEEEQFYSKLCLLRELVQNLREEKEVIAEEGIFGYNIREHYATDAAIAEYEKEMGE